MPSPLGHGPIILLVFSEMSRLACSVICNASYPSICDVSPPNQKNIDLPVSEGLFRFSSAESLHTGSAYFKRPLPQLPDPHRHLKTFES